MLGLHTIHFYYTINSNKNDLKILLYICKITKNKMPTRQELLDRCKGLKLKGFTTKSKDELIKLLESYEEIKISEVEEKIKTPMEEVINELCNSIKKDIRRKVCPNCHELGHDKASNKCILNIELDNKNREKIKQYILSNDNFNDYKLADELGINMSKYKSLYDSIPLCELLKNQEIKEDYFDKILDYSKYNCSLCNMKQYGKNTSSRDWKEYKNICDECWSNYDEERVKLWEQIMSYRKENNCNICGIEKKTKWQRFHYDHLNMFDKKDTIYEMVSRGDDIDTIIVELDKCQMVCISCHSIITHMENKFIFTKIKSNLNKELRKKIITDEEYKLKCDEYNILYREKMDKIYDMFKSKI
jgi:hypothetical protein